jgi:Tol biopolymer transport system component
MNHDLRKAFLAAGVLLFSAFVSACDESTPLRRVPDRPDVGPHDAGDSGVEPPGDAEVADAAADASAGDAAALPDAGQAPSWWILFDSNRAGLNRDLYAIHADGTGLRRLTTDPSIEKEPVLSPDKTKIAFVSDRMGSLNIFVMDLATGAVRPVTSSTVSSEQPAWSPDGSRIAFHRYDSIMTINVDGTDPRLLIEGQEGFVHAGYYHPSYGADGWVLMDRVNEIDVIQTNGTGLHQIVPNDTRFADSPARSPDGRYIAYSGECPRAGQIVQGIWIAPFSGITDQGCGELQLTPVDEGYTTRPAWGPGIIVYERGRMRAELVIRPEAGGDAINLTQGVGDNRDPSWAPPDTILPSL